MEKKEKAEGKSPEKPIQPDVHPDGTFVSPDSVVQARRPLPSE